jgi:PAS domain S-box-containing protein
LGTLPLGRMMENDSKLNFILNSIISNFKHPFICCDKRGNIYHKNKEAKDLLNDEEGENIIDLIDEEGKENFTNLLQSIASGTNVNNEPIVFSVKTNERPIEGRVTGNLYEGEEGVIFLTIIVEKFKTEGEGLTKISSVGSKYEKEIQDEAVRKIIKEFINYYPFTLIGKDKFRREINKLDSFFWIKDLNNKFIIVNEKFAKAIGLKATKVEGKEEKKILPEFQQEINSAAAKYIQSSHHVIIYEGMPVKGIITEGNYRTVEIPVLDSEENPVVIIGTAFKIKEENEGEHEIFNELPNPIFYTDNEKKIRYANREFVKLFGGDLGSIKGEDIGDIFTEELADYIEKYCNTGEGNCNFLFSMTNENNRREDYTIAMCREKSGGISGIISYLPQGDDFENLLTGRGRMFNILIENNPQPIFIYDKETLIFLEVNRAALDLYGYSKDEFLKMDLTDLYTPEDIQTLLDSSTKGIREGRFTGPYRHKKKNGSSVFVELSKISFDFNGKEAHYNTVKDVSEELETKKKTQLFKSVFNNTDNIVIITDEGGFVTFINDHGAETLGYRKGEIEGSGFASLARDEERGNINSSLFNSHINDEKSIKMEMKKGDDSFIESDITVTPIINYNKEIESFLIIGKVEKEKEVIREVIKEVIKEMPVEVIKEVIKEVIVEKPVYLREHGGENISGVTAPFLSSLFHELLTPINVILGFVQEITDNIEKPSEEQSESIEIIKHNRVHLLNIMNSVVELTTLANAKVEKEEIIITDVIDKLQTEMDLISKSSKTVFAYGKISSSLKFITDRNKFYNLSLNLLRIISQMSKENKIYFSAYSYDDDHFIISYKDGYNNISKALMHNLVVLFEGPETVAAKDYGVSKLNMRLIKQLLNLLNGKFINKDKEGKNEVGFLFPIALNDGGLKIDSEMESEAYQSYSGKDEGRYFEEEVTESESEAAPYKIEETNASKSSVSEYEENEEVDIYKEEEIKPEKRENKGGKALDLKQLSCLYIEDQVDSQILFKVQMKELKDIKFAVSFEESLPLLDSHHFDFIVMDINLQGEYNGLDALKIINKMPGYEEIPIIAVTAYVLPGDKEKFIATGFIDFVSKPIFKEKMVTVLEKIFLQPKL